MKKSTLIGLIVIIISTCFSLTAFAASSGGFKGSGETQTTVAKVKEMRDDAPVVLSGHIVQKLGHDTYIFRDDTGEITVDIDDNKWNGQDVGPQDLVELQGEVDKDWNSIEIDVDRVTKK